jgi:hypothetical protein
VNRLAQRINNLSEEIESRNQAESEPAKLTNGVHTAPRSKAKA